MTEETDRLFREHQSIPCRLPPDRFEKVKAELEASGRLWVSHLVDEDNFLAWNRIWCKEAPG